jgi:hypothetical protein
VERSISDLKKFKGFLDYACLPAGRLGMTYG